MPPPCGLKNSYSEANCLNQIVFKINGKIYTVRSGEVPLDTSLNVYLRTHAMLTGTKFMCKEGGCGACIVAMTSAHPATKKIQTFAVNSCLIKLWSCHQTEITTIETAKNYYFNDSKFSISDQLANMNGSQCGYCSPGMVMNMFGLIHSKEGKLTEQDVENGFGGNMCRCTGYKPILDAFRHLVSPRSGSEVCETDIEDIGCIQKCRRRNKTSNSDDEELESCFIEYALAPSKIKLEFGNGTCWYKATTIKEILELFDMISGSYMLINGNTAVGVSPKAYRDVTINNYIDIRDVAELRAFNISASGILIGANITLTEFMNVLVQASSDASLSHLYQYAIELHSHIALVANVPVRNTGTVAGNLSIKYKLLKELNVMFQSDIFLLFESVGAVMTIKESNGVERDYYPRDFLMLPSMDKKLITRILLPPLDYRMYKLVTYKIMPRAQNAPASVNAAFLYKFRNLTTVIDDCTIVYGGINPTFIHASRTEMFLKGKDISDERNLQAAVAELNKEIIDVPDVPPAYPPIYRKKLAINLFYKSILYMNRQLDRNINPRYISGSKKIEESRNLSTGVTQINTPIEGARGKRIPKIEANIQCRGEAEYVNDIPISHDQLYAAMVIAPTGPGLITNVDISQAENMPGFIKYFSAANIPGLNSLFALSVVTLESEELFCSKDVKYAGQPVGMVVATTQDIADTAARAVKITVAMLTKPLMTIDDVMKAFPVYPNLRVLPSPYIPFLNDKRKRVEIIRNTQLHFDHYKRLKEKIAEDKNNQSKNDENVNEISEEEIIEQVKECMIDKANEELMNRNEINGDDNVQSDDVLSSEDTIKEICDEELKKSINEENILNLKVVEGEFDLGSQYHYTMELQSCTVIPIESGEFEVYAATQWPLSIQQAISRILGIQNNKVNVYVRRIGGAYGAKITRAVYPAAACALAASILKRPVRMVMNLSSTMKAIGKRCALKCRYNVLVNSITGKIILFNKLELFNDKGLTLNDPVFFYIPGGVVSCYDVYSKAILGQMNIYTVRTDTPSSAWCRAPGSLEGMSAIEHVMSKIAVNIPNLDPVQIRLNNMNTEKDSKFIQFYLDKANNKINYKAQMESVNNFNRENRWRKQGFSLVPMRFPIDYYYQFYCTVSINEGDGSLAIVHGGCEIGQGVNTKAAVAAAYIFGLPDTSRISVKPTNIVYGPNNAPTGGSMTSDAITYACMKACLTIKERLDLIKKIHNLPLDMNWTDLVKAAATFGCNLNATYMWQLGDPGDNFTGKLDGYTINAVAAAKVEVDILTGQHIVRHVWIFEDVGSSFAPLIDVGQIQGAFIMGLGYFTSEELLFSNETGQLLTDRTWNYDIPGAKDIPEVFDVFVENESDMGAKPNPITHQTHPPPYGVMGAKATGEPPLLLSITVLFAIKEALRSARRDAGLQEVDFNLNAPATNASKMLLSQINESQFRITS